MPKMPNFANSASREETSKSAGSPDTKTLDGDDDDGDALKERSEREIVIGRLSNSPSLMSRPGGQFN